MFQNVIVLIDGSAASWKSVPIAARMAAAVGGHLDLVHSTGLVGEVDAWETELASGIERLGDLPAPVQIHVLDGDDVAAELAEFVESRTGSILVMSSHGHGRSAAVLGSVTDELLRATFGPIVVVGPHVSDDAGELGGRLIVPVDGSSHGESILPIASA